MNKNNNDIASIYKNLLDFVLENYDTDIITLKSYYNITDNTCRNILTNLIKMKKYNILKFLDYSFLYYNCGEDLTRDPIEALDYYINKMVCEYELHPNDFNEYFFGENTCVIEIVNDIFLDPLLESDYINDNYKLIVQSFSDIFYRYSELIDSGYYNDYSIDIYLNDYLNAVFYYLVINNYINSDYDHIINFLNNICDNIENILDTIKISGIKTDKELFKYIDHAYKTININQKTIQ